MTHGRYFEEIEIGESFHSLGRTITESDMVLFTGLTGNADPIHVDEEYCKSSTPYGTRVVHGPLVMSIAFGLTGKLGILEGTTIGFLGMNNWKIAKPVFPGDTIRAKDELVEKRESSKGNSGILTFKKDVFNQRDELVQTFTYVMLVKKKPQFSEVIKSEI